jgi:hypothetical protein
MQRTGIISGGDCHCGHVELSRSPNNPDGYLASIRYKQLHLTSCSLYFYIAWS